jgi:hypothetical protein
MKPRNKSPTDYQAKSLPRRVKILEYALVHGTASAAKEFDIDQKASPKDPDKCARAQRLHSGSQSRR